MKPFIHIVVSENRLNHELIKQTSSCSSTSCDSYGACCLGSGCSFVTEAECLSLGGNYLGDEIPCTEEICISPSCDPVCTGVSEAQYNLPIKYDCDVVVPYNTQTIHIPDGMVPPVTVVLTGNADDLLMIDGQVVDAGQYEFNEPGFGTGCLTGAGNYTFILNSNSFTISSGDTIGINAGYNYTICFYNTNCPPPL